MLILTAAGLQIRLNGFLETNLRNNRNCSVISIIIIKISGTNYGNYGNFFPNLTFDWICNPVAVNIRICNPIIASGDAYTHCSRITNPAERVIMAISFQIPENNNRLSQYVKDRFSEWRAELARALSSVVLFEAKPQRTLCVSCLCLSAAVLHIYIYTRERGAISCSLRLW